MAGIEVRGLKPVMSGVDRTQKGYKRAMHGGMNKACLRVVGRSKSKYFRRAPQSPPKPRILTARAGAAGLLGAVEHQVQQKGKDVEGHVGVRNLPYGRIHEYGGYAGRGHAAHIPKRPYLAPALKDETRHIAEDINMAVWRLIREGGLR